MRQLGAFHVATGIDRWIEHALIQHDTRIVRVVRQRGRSGHRHARNVGLILCLTLERTPGKQLAGNVPTAELRLTSEQRHLSRAWIVGLGAVLERPERERALLCAGAGIRYLKHRSDGDDE